MREGPASNGARPIGSGEPTRQTRPGHLGDRSVSDRPSRQREITAASIGPEGPPLLRKMRRLGRADTQREIPLLPLLTKDSRPRVAPTWMDRNTRSRRTKGLTVKVRTQLLVGLAASVLLGSGLLVMAMHDQPSRSAPPRSSKLADAATRRQSIPDLAPRLTTTAQATAVGPQVPQGSRTTSAIQPGQPPKAIDVGAQRKAFEQRLSASGPPEGTWTDQASSNFDKGMTLLRTVAPDVQLLATACYHDGCVASLRFSNTSAQMNASEKLAMSDDLRAWPGSRIITGPDVQDDSTVLSDWILFAPSQQGELQ